MGGTVFVLNQPEIIQAVIGHALGKEIARSTLQTAGSESKRKVESEKTMLKANGEDLAFINVSVTDRQGNTKGGASG